MKKRIFAYIFVLCIGLSALTGCHKTSKYGQGFRFPLAAEPTQLDPQVATDHASIEILNSLTEGLTVLDEQGNAQPGLAESWKVSSDKKVYTFNLRKGLLWSDKTKLTASDFVFGWQRVLLPDTNSSYTGLFENIKGAEDILKGNADPSTLGITAKDDWTIVVELNEEDDSFLETVASLPFAPCNETFFENTKGRYGLETEDILACGPFEVSLWTHGEYCILSKNESYHDAENVLPSKVRYVIAYKEDELELLEEEGLQAAHIKSNQVKKAEKEGMTTISYEDTLMFLFLNTETIPLKERKVLFSALNEETITKAFDKNHLEKAQGFVPLESKWNGKPYRSDENAVRLFATSESEKTMADDAKQMPTYTFMCSEDDACVDIAQAMVQSWQKKLEVYFHLEIVDEEDVEYAAKTGDYDMIITSQMAEGEAVEDALHLFTSECQNNISLLKDKQFDGLFEKAIESNKKSDFEKAEAYLSSTCCAIPLYNVSRTFAMGEGVDGVKIRPFNGGSNGAIYTFKNATREE